MKYKFLGCTTDFRMYEREEADSLKELLSLIQERIDYCRDGLTDYMMIKAGLDYDDFYDDNGDFDDVRYDNMFEENYPETDEEILEYLACCDSHCYYQTIYKDDEVIYTLHCIDPLV